MVTMSGSSGIRCILEKAAHSFWSVNLVGIGPSVDQLKEVTGQSNDDPFSIFRWSAATFFGARYCAHELMVPCMTGRGKSLYLEPRP